MAEPEIKERGPIQLGDHLNDDDVIKHVRQVRLGILDEQIKFGVPTDSDSFEQLHKNLTELDKSAYQAKRLKQDDKSSEAVAALAKATADALAKSMGIGIFTDQTESNAVEEPLELDGISNPVEGELFIGQDQRGYEEFSNTVGVQFDKARRAANAESEEE
jgi:hypothetical protein